MKAVHIEQPDSMKRGQELEKEEDFPAAIAVYKDMIKLQALDQRPYERLMIIYRKLKEPEKELRIINQAIKTFEKKYQSFVQRKQVSAAVKRLSNSIMKSTGMLDQKGKQLYRPQPLDRWYKRKALVSGKIKK